jgi:hypothetical protein
LNIEYCYVRVKAARQNAIARDDHFTARYGKDRFDHTNTDPVSRAVGWQAEYRVCECISLPMAQYTMGF